MASRMVPPPKGKLPPLPARDQTGTTIRSYKLGEVIGQGANGKVYKALNVDTGDVVAIKQVPIHNIPKVELEGMMREIELLNFLEHPNVVKYHTSFKTKEFLNIVLEFVENGSLANTVKKFGSLPESLIAIYVEQVLQGLCYLHVQGVIHRDIKGANILTTKEGTVKLADFGVATKVESLPDAKDKAARNKTYDDVAGTPYWMAPEVIEMSIPSVASDIWSVGATIIEMLTGAPPYFDLAAMPALFRIVQDPHPPLPKDASPALSDFLMQCFRRDPATRLSARQLLQHKWIVMGAAARRGGKMEGSQAGSGGQEWSQVVERTLELHEAARRDRRSALHSSTRTSSLAAPPVPILPLSVSPTVDGASPSIGNAASQVLRSDGGTIAGDARKSDRRRRQRHRTVAITEMGEMSASAMAAFQEGMKEYRKAMGLPDVAPSKSLLDMVGPPSASLPTPAPAPPPQLVMEQPGGLSSAVGGLGSPAGEEEGAPSDGPSRQHLAERRAFKGRRSPPGRQSRSPPGRALGAARGEIGGAGRGGAPIDLDAAPRRPPLPAPIDLDKRLQEFREKGDEDDASTWELELSGLRALTAAPTAPPAQTASASVLSVLQARGRGRDAPGGDASDPSWDADPAPAPAPPPASSPDPASGGAAPAPALRSSGHLLLEAPPTHAAAAAAAAAPNDPRTPPPSGGVAPPGDSEVQQHRPAPTAARASPPPDQRGGEGAAAGREGERRGGGDVGAGAGAGRGGGEKAVDLGRFAEDSAESERGWEDDLDFPQGSSSLLGPALAAGAASPDERFQSLAQIAARRGRVPQLTSPALRARSGGGLPPLKADGAAEAQRASMEARSSDPRGNALLEPLQMQRAEELEDGGPFGKWSGELLVANQRRLAEAEGDANAEPTETWSGEEDSESWLDEEWEDEEEGVRLSLDMLHGDGFAVVEAEMLRLCAQLDPASRDEEGQVLVLQGLEVLLRTHGRLKTNLIVQHQVLPLLEMLDAPSDPVVCRALCVVHEALTERERNAAAGDYTGYIGIVAQLADNMCTVGLLGKLLDLCRRPRADEESSAVVLQATFVLNSLCWGAEARIIQMVVGCRGIPVLVGLLEADAPVSHLALDCLWKVTNLQGPTPKRDFCRLLARARAAPRLVALLSRAFREHSASRADARSLEAAGGGGGNADWEDLSVREAERVASLLVLFSQADRVVKGDLAHPAALGGMLAVLTGGPAGLPRGLLSAYLKVLRAVGFLSGDAFALDALQRAGAVAALVALLSHTASGAPSEVESQTMLALYNLCKVSKVRQEQAASAGIVLPLMRLIANSSPLRQLAIPLLCDLVHAGQAARLALWRHDGLSFFLRLLELKYWQSTALNCVAVWIGASGAEALEQLEQVLLRPESISTLVKTVAEADADAAPTILPPLGRILQCKNLNRRLGQTSLVSHLVHRLAHPEAVVRKACLELIQALYERSQDPRAFIGSAGGGVNLLDLLSRHVESEQSRLVQEQGRVLLRAMQINALL